MEQVAVQFPKLGLEFNLTREAFAIGDFAIYWYAIIIAVGAVLAVIYGLSQAKKYGINPDKLIDLVIVALVFGIIGARLYYVLFNLENYSSFADIINIRDGGLAIYGGIIFGIASAFVVSRINKTRFLPSLDIAAGALFIGQAIGRWGNFVNQEAFGVNTTLPFGMYSEKTAEYLSDVSWDLFKQGIEVDPSLPVHPCFLYESVWCVLGFLLVLLYRKIRKFDGETFLFYAAWYGIGRAVIEGLRTDSLMYAGFRVSQVLSISAAVVAVLIIVTLRIKISKERKTNPDYMKLYVETAESKAQFMEDPSVTLDKAEAMLNEATNTLNDAQKSLNKLVADEQQSDNTSESDDELRAMQELEEMAEELLSPQEIIELVDKQIDLAFVKITLATSYLEQIVVDEETDEVSAEEAAEEPSEKSEEVCEDNSAEVEDELAVRIETASAQIESAREYIAECFENLNTARESLALKNHPEAFEEQEQTDRDMHEILDTVSDEGDEIDHPSPNESK